MLTFLAEAKGKPLGVDTETTGLHVYDGRDYATGVSVAFRSDSGEIKAHYFPFRHPADNYDDDIKYELGELLSDSVIAYHNAKFDITSLASLGIKASDKWVDTAVLAYLVNENWPASKQLDAVAQHYLGPQARKIKSTELDAWIQMVGWGNVPVEIMRAYATNDAYITLELAEVLVDKVQEELPLDYWWDQKRPLMEVVRNMQLRGVRIDTGWCRKYIDTAEQAMADFVDMLDGLNPASPKDMRTLFVDQLGLPIILRERKKVVNGKRTIVSTPTFDKGAMVEYEKMLARIDDPRAQYVLAYRGWSKAKGFYESYLKLLSPDGRLRPSYRHHKDEDEGGTVTGRLSCAEPNLQQIPKSDPEKEAKQPWINGIKKAFIPKPGYELWEFDYSQLELRLGTAYAREQHLTEVFLEGRDIFTEMSKMLDMSRQNTKTLVYSMQYGAGIQRIMNALGLSQVKAKEVRENYFKTYPGFKLLSERAAAEVERYGSVELWTKRKRHFTSKRESYKAFNSVIQGGAADVVERTMVRVYYEIDQESNGEVVMLLQVHDSIICEIKQGTSDYWVPRISAVMEYVNSIFPFNVKFAVDAHPLHERYQNDDPSL